MEQSEDSDITLIRRIRAGQESAFDELMGRYQRPVLNFAWRMLGDASEAEDVAQEVFARVYHNLAGYESRAKFSTWLYALVRNACVDRLRWRRRHPTDSLEGQPEPAGGDGVAEQVGARELGDQIAAAVAQLPEDQRTAVLLSEYQGCSQAEIAAVMNCSEKSVESRLHRARQALRKRLRHLLD